MIKTRFFDEKQQKNANKKSICEEKVALLTLPKLTPLTHDVSCSNN